MAWHVRGFLSGRGVVVLPFEAPRWTAILCHSGLNMDMSRATDRGRRRRVSLWTTCDATAETTVREERRSTTATHLRAATHPATETLTIPTRGNARGRVIEAGTAETGRALGTGSSASIRARRTVSRGIILSAVHRIRISRALLSHISGLITGRRRITDRDSTTCKTGLPMAIRPSCLRIWRPQPREMSMDL